MTKQKLMRNNMNNNPTQNRENKEWQNQAETSHQTMGRECKNKYELSLL